MGVDINKPWSNELSLCVDLFLSFTGNLANSCYLASIYRHVPVEKGRAASVRNAASSNNLIVTHRLTPKFSLSFSERVVADLQPFLGGHVEGTDKPSPAKYYALFMPVRQPILLFNFPSMTPLLEAKSHR